MESEFRPRLVPFLAPELLLLFQNFLDFIIDNCAREALFHSLSEPRLSRCFSQRT